MAMEFRFDATQDYQLKAIAAAISLLEGQPYIRNELVIPEGGSFAVVANRLDLSENDLLNNLRAVQADQGIGQDAALVRIEETIDGLTGAQMVRFPNFSVEMETGTGKTYVYLRTALELYQRYGLRKFIIVVPSVAVREGVLKTLQVTRRHLAGLYANPPYRYYVYDSSRLAQVRQFTLSDGIEIMVMTIDSFNKSVNVIRQYADGMQGERPIHLIQTTRPVLILDEPQNMESERSVAALAALHPLFALRYSATHRNPYNLVYRLTPFDAYREGLVKRIEVASVVEEDSVNRPFIRLDEITTEGRLLKASVAVHRLMSKGAIREKVITIRPGDSLAEKTKRPEYEGYEVEEINFGGGFVRFANGIEIQKGGATGTAREAIFEAQIRYTVEEHFRKQARLKNEGIKVLSLFFIDKVDNYANADGIVRRLFVRAFDEVKAKYTDWVGKEALGVQAAYFATRNRRGGAVEAIDSNGKSKEDEAAFNLIMRDKERLLSFEEPIAFIFSHSALREGWDNPNVFQICTLREVGSERERRQQVGRGIRLPVDQTGERVHDDRINVLTVVASESYERFVSSLQSEIEAEYGAEGVPPKPPNARNKAKANLRKHYFLKPEFKELWERIRHKTRYAVKIDTERLVASVLPELDASTIRAPRIAIRKAEVIATIKDTFEAMGQSGARTAVDLVGRFPLPNLLEVMESLMENTSPPMRISRRTLLEIYNRTKNKRAAVENPHEFATVAVGIIKDKLTDQLVDGVQYEKLGQRYEMSQFELELETWSEYLVKSERPDGSEGASLYDGVFWDSVTIEKPFIEALERRKDVRLYFRLPDWFLVNTPIGQYNPDWAIVMDNPEDKQGEPILYLVRETKAAGRLSDLRPQERRKILCGKRHFEGALGVSYRVIASAAELP
jgi:type III restriction enzyme